MATGIKVERNAKGAVKGVYLKANSDNDVVQDLIDRALIQDAKKNGKFIPWDEAKKKLTRRK